MALVFGQGLGITENLGRKQFFVSFSGLLIGLRSFRMVLESRLVELQSFLDLDFFGVVDLVLGFLRIIDVERFPTRLYGKSAKVKRGFEQTRSSRAC